MIVKIWIKNKYRKIKCILGFHKWVRADRGESGEIYVECYYCRKESE